MNNLQNISQNLSIYEKNFNDKEKVSVEILVKIHEIRDAMSELLLLIFY